MKPPSDPRSEPDRAALAGFLQSLAHDMRSPLGVVAEVVRELSADFAAQLTDEQRLLGSLANRSLLRLGRIADTVNVLALLDTEGFALTRQPSDLVQLVRAAVAAAVAIETRREVEVSLELPDAAVSADVDTGRLSCALGEVVINAIRHARRHVRVRLEVVPGEVRAVVEDDGQGVAEDQRATLFRRFAPNPSRSGLGVGLSIAHDLVAAHGGRIALEASTLAPGRPGTIGARFVLSLPLAGVP